MSHAAVISLWCNRPSATHGARNPGFASQRPNNNSTAGVNVHLRFIKTGTKESKRLTKDETVSGFTNSTNQTLRQFCRQNYSIAFFDW
jgi:hypothetical protein